MRRHACGFESLRGKVSTLAGLGGPGVKRIEKAIHLEIGERELVSKSSGKERTVVPNRRPATDEVDAAICQDIEIEAGALWCTDQLGRRKFAGAVDVVDLVVTFVPYPAGVHPPEAVASAVASGQSYMLANGERHLSPGVLDLVRQLHACSRGTNDKYAAIRQLIGSAVGHRGDACEPRWKRRGEGRDDGQITGATGQDHTPTSKVSGVGLDQVSAVGCLYGGYRGVAANRCVGVGGTSSDKLDDLGARHEPVGVGAVILTAR